MLTGAPAQTVKLAGTTTAGSGLTVMVNVLDCPVQLFNVGITVMVAVIGKVVVLTAINEGTFSVPELINPISGRELLHE